MDDNKNQNQTNPATSDYQKILDEYAASVKPEPILSDIPSDIPKEENHEPTSIPEPPILDKPIEAPTFDQSTQRTFSSDVPTNETKTPEEIKAQIEKILTDDNASSTSSKPKFDFKKLFFFSLIIFFLIGGGWIYFLFFYSPTNNNSNINTDDISATPTEIIYEEVCELNGNTYQVGESFASADGCNTCSCASVGVISCTEMDCSLIPATTSAIKSATSSNEKIIP
jgi:hypothetical protein